METWGIEAIVSIVLTVLMLIVTFIGHYFYVRGKLHKAAAGAISNAEQDDKTGEEKLELAVDQVYSIVPDSLKIIIHRKTVRKIVQAAFDKIEDYAKKQVEKKHEKKEENNGTENNDVLSSRSITVSTQKEKDSDNDSAIKQENGNSGQTNKTEPEESISWYLI